jgi:hypothetical protein
MQAGLSCRAKLPAPARVQPTKGQVFSGKELPAEDGREMALATEIECNTVLERKR